MSTTGAGGRGPLGDDELGRALSQGLSRAVDGDVDGAALLRGARLGARRIEHRRTVVRRGVATLVVVATLPLGVSVVRDVGLGQASDSSGSGGTAASAPEAASTAASGAASQRDTVAGGFEDAPTAPPDGRTSGRAASSVPAPTPATLIPFGVREGALTRDAGEVAVPDDALLRGTELGVAEVEKTSDTAGQPDAARSLPTTVVPLCGTGPAQASVQGGRAVAWTGSGAGRDGWQVATTVRVFDGTGAADELARLRRAVGTCPESPGVSREPIAGLPGDDVLVAVLPSADPEPLTVVGVLRRGRVTVGVEVVVPRTADPAADRVDGVTRVRALLVRADARVARFAAAAQSDPTLG
jgi:hypothetical protein